LDAALKSSKLMSTLLNDVLDFSKIEAGKLELEVCSFNLRQTLDCVCNLHQASFSAKSSRWCCRIDGWLDILSHLGFWPLVKQ